MNRRNEFAAQEKFAIARTLSPARETRALPNLFISGESVMQLGVRIPAVPRRIG
jgi:hypothetical protein